MISIFLLREKTLIMCKELKLKALLLGYYGSLPSMQADVGQYL